MASRSSFAGDVKRAVSQPTPALPMRRMSAPGAAARRRSRFSAHGIELPDRPCCGGANYDFAPAFQDWKRHPVKRGKRGWPPRRARESRGENRGVEVRMHNVGFESLDEGIESARRAKMRDRIHASREFNRVERGFATLGGFHRERIAPVRIMKLRGRTRDVHFGAVPTQIRTKLAEEGIVTGDAGHHEQEVHVAYSILPSD
jgi:hypothetical protein